MSAAAFGNMEKVSEFTLNSQLFTIYKRVIFNTYCGERQNPEYAEVYINGKWSLNTNHDNASVKEAVMHRLTHQLGI